MGPSRGFVSAGDEARSSRIFVIAFSNGRSLSRCAPLSDREAAVARVSTLRSDVLMGVEPAETPEDGLRHGHLRDALLLPVLSLQIEDRSELPQALALGAQHQVDALTDILSSSVIAISLRKQLVRVFFARYESTWS